MMKFLITRHPEIQERDIVGMKRCKNASSKRQYQHSNLN